MEEARRVAEQAARTAYGRLVSLLAARTRDIAAAEDALSDAFAAALRRWPETGVPTNPDAWLLTAARNALVSGHRYRQVREAAAHDIELYLAELASETEPFADDRLKLLFVCAHPAIEPGMRTPLMLQTVMGLDAARIGSAFLVAPTAMGQRLVRAKARIRDSGIPFLVPDTDQLPERLADVLDAIYAAFGAGWEALGGDGGDGQGLVEEAVYLGRLLVALLPAAPEAKGLLSLMLFSAARQAARRDPQGNFVPLKKQDARLWNHAFIIEADRLLIQAARAGQFGRYQCEAAIQSVHSQRPITGVTNFSALMTLYGLLAMHCPSTGVLVAQASVLLETGDAAGSLNALDAIPAAARSVYQPWWVVRSECLAALGRTEEARAARSLAIGLTEDPAVRRWLAG
jgi:RNA polymerase sigma-70 factor, ECF subfamily